MEDSHPPRGHIRCWLPEILALIGNLLSMIALVTTLAFCDKKPVFDWYGVTLNTLVSVISTAAKAPILFAIAESISQWKWIMFSQQGRRLIDFETADSASRGPWGSLKLLWKCRRDYALQLGALTTVIAIAIDPFSQQLIQYEQSLVEAENPNVAIARAQRYSRGSESTMGVAAINYVKGFKFSNAVTDADYSMQAAILYGLTHSTGEALQQLKFTCPSGNCTWDPFESLSVCSVCNNVSEHISTTQTPDKATAPVLGTIRGSDPMIFGNVITHHLSNGLFIDYVGEGGMDSPWMTTYGTGHRNETVSLQDVETLLWGMSFLRVTNNKSKEWSGVDLEATECGLFYCVKQYNATVRNGTLSEKEEHTTSAFRAVDSWLPQTDEGREALTSLEWLDSLNFNEAFSCTLRSDLMLGDHFNLTQSAIDSISSFFQSSFAANVTMSQDQLTGYARSAIDYFPSSMQAFMSVPNLTATFEALARSMSNTLRADGDNGTVHTGRNGTMQTNYRIVWQWIALHAVVIITGTAFLLMTIHESRKHSIPVWTSSALAALSRGVATRDILHGLGKREELERQAAQACVQLLDRKPRLKGNTDPKSALVTVQSYSGSSEVSLMEDIALNDAEDRGLRRTTVVGTNQSL